MKNKWLVLPALLLVMSLVFLGCDDGSKAEPPMENLTEVSFAAGDIVLEIIGNGTSAAVEGNKFTLKADTDQGSTGFRWKFPDVIDPENPAAKQKDYQFIEVTMEIVAITAPTNGVDFNAKTSSDMQGDVNRWGETAQYKAGLGIFKEAIVDNAWVPANEVLVGATNTAKYPLNVNRPSIFTKPFDNQIAFQWNNYSYELGGRTGSDPDWDPRYEGTAVTDFTIAITAIKFIPYEGSKGDEEDPPPPPPPTGEVVLDLATWIAGEDDPTKLGWPLEKSGGPTVAVENGALKFTGREHDWDCVKILLGKVGGTGIDPSTGIYTIEVEGTTTAGTKMKLMLDGSYKTIVSTNAAEDGTFSLVCNEILAKYDDDAAVNNESKISIQNEGGDTNPDFTITKLKIQYIGERE